MSKEREQKVRANNKTVKTHNNYLIIIIRAKEVAPLRRSSLAKFVWPVIASNLSEKGLEIVSNGGLRRGLTGVQRGGVGDDAGVHGVHSGVL